MEKWKIGVIAVLLLGLVGYGVSQQKSNDASTDNSLIDNVVGADATVESGQPNSENKAASFIGQEWGSASLPAWSQLGPWENTQQPTTVASLKGQPSLVEFFRIKCSHCQDAAPFMEALYKRYQPRGLKMVAVQTPGDYKDKTNAETMWPSVQAWIKAAKLTYPIAMDKDSQYFQQTIKGTYYPTTIIADANGKIVHAQTGHDIQKTITLAVEIEKLFPGAGTPKERAADLAKFLRPFVFGSGTSDAAMEKALADDLEQRLTGKV